MTMTAPGPAPDLAQQEAIQRRYLEDQIETAPPERRLMMLFDRLLLHLEEAAQAFEARQIESIHVALISAQQILFALRDPLDTATPLGASLTQVYTFCISSLIDANLKKDPRALPQVRQMIERITEANRKAAASLSEATRPGQFEGVA